MTEQHLDNVLVTDLLSSWQRTREAIGTVETSLPSQLSDSMKELISARAEMENSIRAFMIHVISN